MMTFISALQLFKRVLKSKTWRIVKRNIKVLGRLPDTKQNLLLTGNGTLIFRGRCQFGYKKSPLLYSTYSYVEARDKDTVIILGDACIFNNGISIVAEGAGEMISIGDRCVCGTGVQIFCSDFHGLRICDRNDARAVLRSPVRIHQDCWIGDNVMILKGVTLGKGSVVGAGSVVTKSFPDNSIIAGNPARLIRTICQNNAET